MLDLLNQEELGGILTQVLCGRTPHLRHQGIHIGCGLAQKKLFCFCIINSIIEYVIGTVNRNW